jgi:digalactosyldiacylglycerol synthase
MDVYYIGKLVWSKSYRELIKLFRDRQKKLTGLKVDLIFFVFN